MARDLTGVMAAAVAATLKSPVIFYEGVFASGTLRLCSLPYTISWDGQSWVGAGNLLGFSPIEESSEIRASGCTISLVANSAIVQLAAAQSLSGQLGKVWIGMKGDEVVAGGTAQAGASDTLTLAAGASATDHAYNRMKLSLSSGAGSVQERTISAYAGATRVATVSPRWAVNMVLWSEDLTQADWVQTAVVTGAQYTDSEGSVLDLVDDDNVAVSESVEVRKVVPNDSAPYLLSCKFKKTVGDAHYGGARILFDNGGVTVDARITCNTNTGVISTAGAAVASSGVEDKGDTWRFWLVANNNSSGNLRIRGFLYPAISITGGNFASSVTGSKIMGAAQMEQSATVGEYIETTGAGIALPDNTTVYELINPDGIIADPFLSFEGRLDIPRIQKGERPIVSIAYESRLRDLERPREERITHEEQQRLFPGDKGREYVAELQDKTLIW